MANQMVAARAVNVEAGRLIQEIDNDSGGGITPKLTGNL